MWDHLPYISGLGNIAFASPGCTDRCPLEIRLKKSQGQGSFELSMAGTAYRSKFRSVLRILLSNLSKHISSLGWLPNTAINWLSQIHVRLRWTQCCPDVLLEPFKWH